MPKEINHRSHAQGINPYENSVGTFVHGSDPREVNDVLHEKTSNPDGNTEPRKPVQPFDSASVIERLRGEKTFEEHGRSILVLAHEPSLRLALTAIAAGRRTGERRVAGASTGQVLEGEVRFRAGEEQHVLSAGGTLVLQGKRILRGGGHQRRRLPAHAGAAGRAGRRLPAAGAPGGARGGART